MLENATPSSSDPHFVTQKTAILEIWDRMQKLQTDFAIAQELSFYYTSAECQSARTVLDIGSGNGYYLGKIASRFPEKTYYGIDPSAELIAVAEQESEVSNVSFSCRELSEVTDSFDFVLMRLLLQHLEDVPGFFDEIAAVAKPGRSALIIDAHDPVRFFYPEFPDFMRFFTAYCEKERKAGRDRCVANRIKRALESSTAWKLGETTQLVIPSTIPGNMALFTETYTSLVDLVEQAGELSYDFPAVKEAWRRWSQMPGAYTQVGLNLIRIERP
jgi:SAM-dependent methyltransferase